MGLFRAFTHLAIDTVLLPVAVVKDAVTLGNVGERKTYTEQALEQLRKDADKFDD